MKQFIQQGLSKVSEATDKIVDEFLKKYRVVRQVVDGLPIFVSSEKTLCFPASKYDEKHYFVVPYKLSPTGFALHSMRCLPDGSPEVNDLPKRRVFHFANKQDEENLKTFLLEQTKSEISNQPKEQYPRLEALANDIDKMDRKLTFGLLAVGGLAALVNPLLGAGIAAKAIIPAVLGIFAKHGIELGKEKYDQYQLEKKIRDAEQHVAQQFEESSTIKCTNPLLQELEVALATSADEHDPNTAFDIEHAQLAELDNQRWRDLTILAMQRVYDEVLKDPSQYEQAQLGPEDIEWLTRLFALAAK